MKKIFALTLAVAMVLSLAAVAFAADDEYAIWEIDPSGVGHRKFSSDSNWVKKVPVAGNEVVNYGNTIYYELSGETFVGGASPSTKGPVEKYEAVNGVRINQTWDIGEDWVSKVELIKRKSADIAVATGGAGTLGTYSSTGVGGYEYFLAVTFKGAATETDTTDVVGEIFLKDSTGSNKINRNKDITGSSTVGETNKLMVNVELKYSGSAGLTVSSGTVTDGNRVFDFGAGDEEFELTFADWGAATFTVSTIGQGDLVLKATAKYNSEIGALYPEANLDFFNGNGVSFNKTGEMFIPADEGSFIYELKNGVLVAVAGAEYDEYDEGFYFKTRTLGTYVVSDAELDLAGTDVVAPVTPDAPEVVNPSTGAAA
jgi:hypothetical protein